MYWMKKIIVLFLPFTFLLFSFSEILSQEKEIWTIDTLKVIEIEISDEEINLVTPEGKEYKYQPKKIERITTDKKIEKAKERKRSLIRKDIVRAGTDIIIDQDEEVDGDVTAIGGDVVVKGVVDGNVVSIWGDILVTSVGIIEEDVTSVGGEVTVEPGGIIKGEKVEVKGNIPGANFPSIIIQPKIIPRGFGILAWMVKILIFLFLGMIVFSVVPKNVGKVKDKVENEFLKSLLIGLLAWILFLPAFVLLLITIIGIPLAILLPLVLIVATIVGYTAASLFIGEKIKQNTKIKPQTPLLTVLLGIIAIDSIAFLGVLTGVWGHALLPLSTTLTVVYWVTFSIIVTTGLGSVIITRFGARPKEAKMQKTTPEGRPTSFE
ncbi:MAG: hypothetical protein AMJ90_02460 [candidate division Zixibacteria bacterium SM23_73_2]|nr:MAG: hypothetical protein AMJ90_02460 [candidate division Zixibacteria bacterium SM23_73_2]